MFAARTADASIEELDRAPPRGVHHHYARLAMWDAGAGTATDCRPKKGAGCCTFVVRPGEDIQAAIDNLPAAGGCVCLKAGLHLVDDTIVIARSNVTLHGESMGAIVRNDRGGVVLLVGQAQAVGTREVRVASIVFQQGGEGGGVPVVGLGNVESVVIDDCRLEAPGRRFGEGLIVFASADVTVSGCVVTGAAIGAWCFGRNRDVTITGCEFRASEDAEATLGIGILAQAMAGPITIEDNLVSSPLYGIVVDDDPNAPISNALYSRICGNRVGISRSPNLPQRVFAIDVASEASVVDDNQVEHRGGNIAGIRLCGNGSAAHGNVIRRSGREQPSPTTGAPAPEVSIAIMAGFQGPKGYLPLERLTIADNVVEGLQHGIALGGVARSRVSGNILGDGALLNVNGIAAHQCSECLLTENIIVRNAFGILLLGGDRNMIGDNRLDGGGFGIAVLVEEAPTISGNRLTDLTQNGILLWSAAQRCNVIENRIVRCGSAAAVANGIGAWGILGELHVESNEVMDIGAATAPPCLRDRRRRHPRSAGGEQSRHLFEPDPAQRGRRRSGAADAGLVRCPGQRFHARRGLRDPDRQQQVRRAGRHRSGRTVRAADLGQCLRALRAGAVPRQLLRAFQHAVGGRHDDHQRAASSRSWRR